MQDFQYQVPTQVFFGQGAEKEVGQRVKEFGGHRVLLHFGSRHSKQSGLIDRIAGYLHEQSIETVELGGVQPNPRLSLVYRGIELCRREKVDFILAVGGGSVIDSAKAIALGVPYEGDVWDFFTRKQKVERLLALGAVVTMPAAGSEVAVGSVITNEDGMQKIPLNNRKMRPLFAVLDPLLTLSLPPYQTACGIADIFSHVMENYFSRTRNTELGDRLCEACMKTLIHNGRILMESPGDVAARSEIMWAASLAQSGLLSAGRQGDWGSHDIENELSAVYDVAHGAGLAVVFPGWMKHVFETDIQVFVRFATRVWDLDPSQFPDERALALEGIGRLSEFFTRLGLPSTLAGLGVPADQLDMLAERAVKNGGTGQFMRLSKEDVLSILKNCAQ